MKYRYFVSYSHPNGFGAIEIIADRPLVTMDRINDVADKIKDEMNINNGSVVILWFKMLPSVPKEVKNA